MVVLHRCVSVLLLRIIGDGVRWLRGRETVFETGSGRFPVQTRAPPGRVSVEESLGKTLNP